MLSSLHIENIAVVKRLDVDLEQGMTVLTGETGAGKSIIIDSLGLLLGGRADKELIRNGENRAEVSAMFCGLTENTKNTLSELGITAEDDSIMISRTVSTGGSSARINGRAVTVGVLREISATLFSIHGQNDNQRLLDPSTHIDLIDSYAENREELEKYRAVYKDILHLKNLPCQPP